MEKDLSKEEVRKDQEIKRRKGNESGWDFERGSMEGVYGGMSLEDM